MTRLQCAEEAAKIVDAQDVFDQLNKAWQAAKSLKAYRVLLDFSKKHHLRVRERYKDHC